MHCFIPSECYDWQPSIDELLNCYRRYDREKTFTAATQFSFRQDTFKYYNISTLHITMSFSPWWSMLVRMVPKRALNGCRLSRAKKKIQPQVEVPKSKVLTLECLMIIWETKCWQLGCHIIVLFPPQKLLTPTQSPVTKLSSLYFGGAVAGDCRRVK